MPRPAARLPIRAPLAPAPTAAPRLPPCPPFPLPSTPHTPAAPRSTTASAGTSASTAGSPRSSSTASATSLGTTTQRRAPRAPTTGQRPVSTHHPPAPTPKVPTLVPHAFPEEKAALRAPQRLRAACLHHLPASCLPACLPARLPACLVMWLPACLIMWLAPPPRLMPTPCILAARALLSAGPLCGCMAPKRNSTCPSCSKPSWQLLGGR